MVELVATGPDALQVEVKNVIKTKRMVGGREEEMQVHRSISSGKMKINQAANGVRVISSYNDKTRIGTSNIYVEVNITISEVGGVVERLVKMYTKLEKYSVLLIAM